MQRLTLTLLFFALVAAPSFADDWPQWLGPQRDGVWREDGIVDTFPQSGLKVLWRTPISGGYSGPAVADGKVYVTDYQRQAGEAFNNPGARADLQGRERVLCLDAKDGALIWKHEYECPYSISYPAGPRTTPLVNDGRVYTLGAEGNLVCLDADKGNVVWSKELKKEYQIPAPIWGFSGHPMIDGDTLYCLVGGEGSVAVAFDKRTGEEKWRALSAPEPGYSPPTMIESGGVSQLLIWHPLALNSLNPSDGKTYWSIPLRPLYGMSIMAPQKHEDVLFASGIGNAAVALKLPNDTSEPEEIWHGHPKTGVYASNSTPLIVDDVIYGADCQVGDFRAVDLKTGAILWSTFEPTTGGERRASHGTAFVVRHKDRFFLFSETGDLVLANLSPKRYEEISRFRVLEPTNEAFGRPVVWSHPAFASQCVFARNDKEIVCVSLAK